MANSLPDLPRRAAHAPKLFEIDLIAKCIHGCPESIVLVRTQLTILRQPAQRIEFPDVLITAEIIEDRRLKDEKSTADPAPVSLRFFNKVVNLDAIAIQRREPASCLDSSHRRVAVLLRKKNKKQKKNHGAD